MILRPRERAIRQRLKDDFLHYAARCLKIRTKAGRVEPFQLNEAQRYIHGRVEEQRARTGKVRAIILKGRQQGCSTYVEGRFYWRVSHSKGVRAFILTHEEEATNNLFELADRYHENCPDLVKPMTGASNAKELYFNKLDSGYKVGTAGNKAVGRSSTIQLFHGSEVGFWPNAQSHAAGILQAIPDEPGTEVWLESTANGIGNYYHQQWQAAESGIDKRPESHAGDNAGPARPDFAEKSGDHAARETVSLDLTRLRQCLHGGRPYPVTTDNALDHAYVRESSEAAALAVAHTQCVHDREIAGVARLKESRFERREYRVGFKQPAARARNRDR